MRVAFLGFGLIGGSIARAVRARAGGDDGPSGSWRIVAWTPGGAGPRAGVAAGVVDVAATTPEAALDGAELVVLAAPVPDCLAMLDDLAGPWRSALGSDAVVTDVASSKRALVLRATALGLRFVGGHPMAGREASGFEASASDLLVERPWVLVPTTDAPAMQRVERLVLATGAHPVHLAATAHDAAVAGISHLPLVTSVALVEAVAGGTAGPHADWPVAADLAATGWRDATRLARGDVAMGTGIIVTNADAIATRLRATIDALEGWLLELERPGGPDQAEVAGRLQAARDRLEAMAR